MLRKNEPVYKQMWYVAGTYEDMPNVTVLVDLVPEGMFKPVQLNPCARIADATAPQEKKKFLHDEAKCLVNLVQQDYQAVLLLDDISGGQEARMLVLDNSCFVEIENEFFTCLKRGYMGEEDAVKGHFMNIGCCVYDNLIDMRDNKLLTDRNHEAVHVGVSYMFRSFVFGTNQDETCMVLQYDKPSLFRTTIHRGIFVKWQDVSPTYLHALCPPLRCDEPTRGAAKQRILSHIFSPFKEGQDDHVITIIFPNGRTSELCIPKANYTLNS